MSFTPPYGRVLGRREGLRRSLITNGRQIIPLNALTAAATIAAPPSSRFFQVSLLLLVALVAEDSDGGIPPAAPVSWQDVSGTG